MSSYSDRSSKRQLYSEETAVCVLGKFNEAKLASAIFGKGFELVTAWLGRTGT